MPELDPIIRNRLESACTTQNTYRPNDAVAAQLGDRALVMLVGPAAAGKSFIMNEIVTLDQDFRRVPVFSTRPERPDDEPGMFRCYPHDNEHVTRLLDEIDRGNVVQYAIHPTQGTMYGTLPEDYPGTYNLLATLSGVVDGMRTLPFKTAHVIGLTAPGATWQRWFDARYPSDHPERPKRIEEAIISLEWLLDETRTDTVTWIENESGHATEVARQIIHHVRQKQPSDTRITNVARDMLSTARKLRDIH